MPAAVMSGGPYGTLEQQGALRRLAEAILSGDGGARMKPLARSSVASRRA